ncbi:MAG: PAS domain S-box protein [Deltaproteobacteria bacterium]|nr:PAS domain S-box protein [Deltaproteobacteria bacterium]
MRALFETAHDAIGVSVAGTHVMVNAAYLRLFGYERAEEVLGRPILDLIAPAARVEILERVKARLVGKSLGDRYETRGLRRDGTEFDMEVQVSPYELDGVVHTLVTLRDVTEMRRVAQQLREGQAFYKALFEVNTAVKILVDPETGQVVDANPAASAFYGYPLDVLRQMKVMDLNPAPPARVKELLQAAARGQQKFFQLQHRLASGELRDVELHSGPFQHGGRTLLMSIVHDATERRRLEERLRQGQKLEALGRLAGGIAHDFNNILTAIIGHGSIAQELVRGEAREHLDEIIQNARRAGALTRQLLAMSRQQVLQPRVIDVGAVVAGMENLLRRALGERVALTTELGKNVPCAVADAGQLEQVILNLAANARDAMPRGGPLTLRTALVEGRGQPVVGGTLPPGRWVALSVRDAGEGMDEASASRVFDPFFATPDQAAPSGLGLTSVYGVVQQSGGHIALETAPGAGCCFTVYLPASDAPPGTATAGTALGPAGPRPATVLVVEDNEDVRRFLVLSLKRAGHAVLEAGDGTTALQLAASHAGTVDLLVTDVMIPDHSGPEVYEQLHGTRPGMKVLFISGFADGQLEGFPRDAAFLQKPFTGRDLTATVRALLDDGASPAPGA